MNVNNSKLRVVSVGSTPMTEKINELLESMASVDLVGVVNLEPEKYYNRSNFAPMYEFKNQRPDDIIYINNINDASTIQWIKSRKPDIILQSGWSQIWKEDVLNIPKLFCLGIHAAPLPEGKGAAILNWKLIEGGGSWGNSLFIMEDKTDTGDILDFEPFTLEERDDIRTAYLKADRTALTMVKRTLPKILNGTYKQTSQKGLKGSRYYSRKPKDGEMSFDWNSEKILNYVRALTHPYPGAFFNTNAGKLTIWSAEKEGNKYYEQPGTILKIEKGKGILLQIGDSESIWLKAITPEDDTEVWSDIWAFEKKLGAGIKLNMALVNNEIIFQQANHE